MRFDKLSVAHMTEISVLTTQFFQIVCSSLKFSIRKLGDWNIFDYLAMGLFGFLPSNIGHS